MLSSSSKKKVLAAVGWPTWVFIGFVLAQVLVVGLVRALGALGVTFQTIDEAVFNAVANGIIYALAIFLIIGVPWYVRRAYTTKKDIGLHRLPLWSDMPWALAGLVAYFILTTLVAAFAMYALPFVDYSQTQDTGFSHLANQAEFIVAFISLVVIAPVAEEVLFRGYLLGKLRRQLPDWLAAVITSVLFGIVHFQWNVSLDVFALSLVLCTLRINSGSLWSPIMLHMLKNGIAFYFLFVNPVINVTMGG